MAVFANILKTLRTDKHLSQQELATRLGISKSAVSMYEQGRREPDFDILNKIADIFQVDADYLLGRSSLSHELSRLPHTLIPLTLRRLSWMMLKNTFNLSVQKENNKGAFRNGYAEQI
jgi:transcriptional regulator with XRE-family HTH domain